MNKFAIYILSFKIFFPTWIICIFFLLWDNIVCAVIAIGLLVFQSIQIHFNKKKYILNSDYEAQKNQIMKDAEMEKKQLNDIISEKDKEAEYLKKQFEESCEKAKENIAIAISDTKKERWNYVQQLEQQVAMLRDELDLRYKHGEFVGFAGHYRVGTDIDTGSYLIVPQEGKNAIIELHSSYSRFKRQEESIFSVCTEHEYRIALSENGTYITIENGNIYHSSPIRINQNRDEFDTRYDIPILEED